MKTFIILGSINMALAIAFGAFGAHGLEGRITERMISNWHTGAHYHLIHALGMMIIGLLMFKAGAHTSWLTFAGWLLFAGILLFSGSLYLMALTGITKLGMITPLGGLAFIAGWLLVTVFAVKQLNS